MRFIAFILAIIILAISCVPCADRACALTAYKIKSELVKSSGQQDNHGQRDACTPFCQCSCCGVYSINHVVVAGSPINLLAGKDFISYMRSSVVEISLPIWQPPQLAV